MAESDRRYMRLERCKSRLAMEKEYKDILLKDIDEQVEKEAVAFEAQEREKLYRQHPEWMPKEQVYETVYQAKLRQFDSDMEFEMQETLSQAARIVSKNPEQKEIQDSRLKELAEKQARLREKFTAHLEAALKEQLKEQVDIPPDEEKALLGRVEDFRLSRCRETQAKKEKISADEDAKIKKLEASLKKAEGAVSKTGLSMPEDTVLSVQNLCMYFGGVHAVENLSFDVKKGEIFGLIGPNGAGKTTVFNCITQFYKPTSGTLLFENKAGEIISLTDESVHNVICQGIVRTFQNVEVIREVSVLENLLIAGHSRFTLGLAAQALHLPQLKKQERIIKEKAMKVLEFMGLSDYKDWTAAGLPYGILKKIEIARTLMCDPQLIILDEPAAGLNDTETASLTELILRIRDTLGCTILLVEHDMGLVMNVCQTICAISFGELLAIGSPEEIQNNPDVQKAYLGESEEEAN